MEVPIPRQGRYLETELTDADLLELRDELASRAGGEAEARSDRGK